MKVAKSKVNEAKQLLDQWKLSYFENRAEIEKSARARRWEFDHKRLFEKTDYMASVCQDLCNVFQVSVHIHLLAHISVFEPLVINPCMKK